MDLDWIPDVLDDDIDGDGISNEMERAASLVLTFYDPMDPHSVPADSDFDTIPDAIDEDDDNAMAGVLFRGSRLCPVTGGS